MIAALALVLLFLLSPAPAFAQVALNEIYAPTSNDDWVEIYNDSTEQVDLNGWQISDSTSVVKTFPSDTLLPALGFLWVPFSNRLNNSGDSVNLLNSAGETLDSFTYTTTQLEKSFSRSPDGTGAWNPNGSRTKGLPNTASPAAPETPPPTPGETNSPAGNISLQEFMPNPSSGDEWARVYNPNNFSLEITGWKIDDQEGGSAPFSIPKGNAIGPGQTQTFYFSARLNNSNDSIRLLSPQGTVVEFFSYSQTTKGVSFVKSKNGTWVLATSGSTSSSPVKSKTAVASSTQPSVEPSEQPNNEAATLGSSTNSSKLQEKNTPVYKSSNSLSPISLLFIAAGLSTLGVALIWPFLEKRFFKKKSKKK